MKQLTPEFLDSLIKLIIGTTFCFTVLVMVTLSLYSVVFVTQPMQGMSPADKQFFLLLSDMSKYILGSLATLLAVKGKDGVARLVEPPPGISTPKDWQDKPAPAAPAAQAAASAATAAASAARAGSPRSEPTLDAVPVQTGFAGKPAPPPLHDPEI